MTLGRYALSIFCSIARAHAPVDVVNENPLSQPTLSLSTVVGGLGPAKGDLEAALAARDEEGREAVVQGYLAHKKLPPPP